MPKSPMSLAAIAHRSTYDLWYLMAQEGWLDVLGGTEWCRLRPSLYQMIQEAIERIVRRAAHPASPDRPGSTIASSPVRSDTPDSPPNIPMEDSP